MKKRNRRVHDDAFKVKVVLEALKEVHTMAELAGKYEVHPNQIGQWRKQFLKNATTAFSGDKSDQDYIRKLEGHQEELHAKIGEQSMDIKFLKKKCKQLGLI